MTRRDPSADGGGIRYFVPAISHVLFVVLFLHLSFNVGNNLLNDGDTGYHVRAGELILGTSSVPHQDSFSFLSPPPTWTAHEWLAEVIMALVHRASGLTGLVLFFIFLIALTYALLFRILRSWNGDFLVDIVIIVLVIISSQIHWLARPHVFSLLIIVVWYSLLDAYQYRDRNLLYVLPPLMLAWVNLHGGFIFGFVLLGAYLAGNIVKSVVASSGDRRRFRRKAAALGIASAACLIVSLVNPNGHSILAFPFRVASDTYLMDHVGEFLSPNFHGTVYFKYLLYMTMAFLAFSRTPLDIIEVALTILFMGMSLYSQRYILLFAIVAAPILSRQGSSLLAQADTNALDTLKRKSANLSAIDASARGFVWPLVAVLVVVALAPGGRIQFRFDAKKKPVAAVEFLKKADLRGNMFNNDEFGDYVIYSAYPQYKVFIDGRLDMYGSNKVKEYFTVMEFRPGMDAVLRKYGIDWFLIESDSVLSRYLWTTKDWRLIYSDSVASIFVRDIGEYRDLIKTYKRVTPFVDNGTVLNRQGAEGVPAPLSHR